jgi:hypothetical protein
MTKRQFVVLAFRLFALYLVFNLVSNLGYIFSIKSGLGAGVLNYYLIPGVAIFASLAFISLLWLKSEWLMQKIFAILVLSDDAKIVDDESNSEGQVERASENIPEIIGIQDYYETPLTKESVEIVAISVVGLWATFNQLPHLFKVLDLVISPISFFLNWFTIRMLLPDLIQVALGIWLFLRPWQFQGWIEKFKPKAVPADDESDPKLSS